MYKLIAIDLDGTLLNSYGEVSDENRQAIKQASENNIEIVLTSGRMSSSVIGIADDIGANNYMIAGNGALVYDLKNQSILYNKCIPIEKVLEIINICEENDIYYTLSTEKYIIAKKLSNNLMYYYYENSRKPENKTTNINIVQNIAKYIKESDPGEITKITISDENKVVFSGIMKKLKEIKGINVLEVSNMSRKVIKSGTEETEISYFYTEITKEGVSKWEAIKGLAEHINIKENEIAAIGDNINDMDMILNAGLGIVMGNSALASKNLGKVIVKDNNSNGVAEAIKKYILMNLE